ncbi:RNA polymerase sigma-70 factor [Rhodococcus coprophilus]|uniref:ECF family sigma-70 type sigma factor n=1 Tax=Rhodococcus coprophilus TaxID=38310 RepID=A0A2X4U5N6_9NOCA|nr:RNA polymerase sigma-70 factor [Rhodococcus coprophilus]MBM7457876.1 RNA polymerase sigma-70 factor (ECF subfamily) [Rhodococcus coprophilus]SQI30498.1 ECF family sigma-70 type sigma factor [Rhodococcus coprophilus]
MTAEDVFSEHRRLLFSIAYEITGSVADAEDVLQDSFVRWAGTDRATVDNPRAYVAQIVTRQALNSLRSARRRREEYVGPWLPEPVLTSPDASSEVELAESVSLAMLLVLETLSPVERAVFVMREVFGFDHARIAETVDRREDAVRQIAHRAREHVRARRRRFTPAGDETDRVVAEFMVAATSGDLDALLRLLAPDVVYIADGGGKVSAARVPVTGATRVARLFAGLVRRPLPDMSVETAPVGNMPGLLVYSGGKIDLVLQLEIDDGLITGVYVVRNPDKLAHFGAHPGPGEAI